MKTFKYFSVLLFSVWVLLATSCKRDEADTEAPVISVSGPEADEVLFIGSEIHFEVDFSDNTELKSYKVDIHSNFDGHSHKGGLADSVAWSFQKSWNFDAGQRNAHVHHHEIAIPTEFEGKAISQGDYHFMIYCTDASGNETWTAVAVQIMKSTDAVAPEFSSIVAPTENEVFTNGETITISGTVSDNELLDGLFIAIMPAGSENAQADPTNALAVMLHEHDAVHEQQSFNFSASITVGQAQDNNTTPKDVVWAPGNYFIVVKAPDVSGNVGFSEHYPIVIQ